jgi:hypothetical protein
MTQIREETAIADKTRSVEQLLNYFQKKLLTRKGQLCIITIEQMFNCLQEQAGS